MQSSSLENLSQLLRSIGALVLLLLWAAFLPGPAAAEPVPFKTAWLAENEAFPAWYARQMGWDRQSGLSVEMLRFDTGRALLEGIKAYKWVIGGCGALPAAQAPLKDAFAVVAAGNDDSQANLVLVRPDSPILQAQGAAPDYPLVRGSAETAAKATVICPKDTSAHYTLVRWLESLGLTEEDVRIEYHDPAQALGVFKAGRGDVLVIWSPWQYALPQDSAVLAARGSDCGAFQPTVLVTNRALEDKFSKEIKAFLSCYLRAAAHIKEHATSDEVVDLYQTFFKEWLGRDIDHAQAAEDLAAHELYPLEAQLALFAPDGGESRMHKAFRDIADFFGKHVPTPERQDMETRVPRIEPGYLEALAEQGADTLRDF